MHFGKEYVSYKEEHYKANDSILRNYVVRIIDYLKLITGITMELI